VVVVVVKTALSSSFDERIVGSVSSLLGPSITSVSGHEICILRVFSVGTLDDIAADSVATKEEGEVVVGASEDAQALSSFLYRFKTMSNSQEEVDVTVS